MKSTISKGTYRAMYRLLDRVSPIDGDCGKLCGAACCTCDYTPEDIEYVSDGDVNASDYMGLFLLPGEEQVYEGEDTSWLDWGHLMAEEYDYPESWEGKVYFLQCKTPPVCNRKLRPIQCRTFPLAPHIDEYGVFHIIKDKDEYPYECPLTGDMDIQEDFVKATYTVWKHLIRDPYICDLVLMDSEYRLECGIEIQVLI
ncbi:MAG: hypothetical protein Q4B78_05095 [Bacillota bacterium]|nr:hypothetical protein [Bacillota bacterium]